MAYRFEFIHFLTKITTSTIHHNNWFWQKSRQARLLSAHVCMEIANAWHENRIRLLLDCSFIAAGCCLLIECILYDDSHKCNTFKALSMNEELVNGNQFTSKAIIHCK